MTNRKLNQIAINCAHNQMGEQADEATVTEVSKHIETLTATLPDLTKEYASVKLDEDQLLEKLDEASEGEELTANNKAFAIKAAKYYLYRHVKYQKELQKILRAVCKHFDNNPQIYDRIDKASS